MSRSQIEFLYHILDETNYLLKSSKDLSKTEFLAHEDLKRAFTRSLEIIGEASKNVADEIKYQHPSVDWKGMARMRDKLIHHYFGVDYELVWDVISQETPKLQVQLTAVIRQIKAQGG